LKQEASLFASKLTLNLTFKLTLKLTFKIYFVTYVNLNAGTVAESREEMPLHRQLKATTKPFQFFEQSEPA